MDALIRLFALIGIATVALVIYSCAEELWLKIKRWRKNNTKIKCLCKPHVYEPDWIWSDKEAEFKCIKCGKKKKMYIDRESFNKWFGKKENKDE